ncbi:hypothetical protein KY285_007634 [Solanum tuberosum]|nr:hypothetical protein KY289_007958 [Solanum tuberosum]KAH0745977.1 hypothetical protein KY285_007634 [Solanum tuberosum]
MEIRYMMEDNVTPMEIRNEMGMWFFMKLKRRQSNCGLYPLCITTEEQNFGCSNNGEISFDQDTSMVEVGLHKVVKIKQLYKDKSTIVAVMQKYAIDNRFQFKILRSNKKRSMKKCVIG